MRTKKPWVRASLVTLAWIGLLMTTACREQPALDEAKARGLTPEDLPPATDDYFRESDGGVQLDPDEVEGRNTWMIWTAGNQAFWDYIANRSFGTVDLLRIISSYPGGKYSRDNRFRYFGIISEPGFRKPTRADGYGLWLDERVAGPEPFDSAVYGRASGVVGLRLFPNPDFDEAARRKWDAVRYYTDRNYYYDRNLVRPYRVGMSCAFCHVSFDPVRQPADPENPEWRNLSAYIGNQYFWVGRVFGTELDHDNFVWQLFNSSPPGALETSMIATDNINNPRNVNAIYNVQARLGAATEERLAGSNLSIPGTSERMRVPHVLKDGADAVGILGALSRVYINIGEFHQEWVRHHNPILGGRSQSPIPIALAQQNSVYYRATEQRVENLAKYFLKAARPHRLADAPGGSRYLTRDAATLTRGKIVFAEQCARCHSSKQPSLEIAPDSPNYVAWMRREVLKPDFTENNFLSTDQRLPVTEVKTNACAALASNAVRGHVWDNFSPETYKTSPAVGTIEVYNPFDSSTRSFVAPGGGRGYYRVPSLVSIWASAPFFHNNSLGEFTNDPSVDGRMAGFNDAAVKLLWPARRGESECTTKWGLPSCGPVYRTTEESYIVIHKAFLPKILRPLLGWKRFMGMAGDEVRIGPIPKGTPINLLANLDLEIEAAKIPELVRILIRTKKALQRIDRERLGPEESRQVLRALVPDLLTLSKCPDFVVDRGHEYGSDLPDADKRALIEFLKTF